MTELCDRVSFAFCSGEEASGEACGIRFRHDGVATTVLDPWPLGVAWLSGIVGGFAADGYPTRLVPVVEVFRVEPAE